MKKLVMAAALLAASLHTLAADAADCSALTKLDGGNPTANPVPTVYYVTGSTAVKPLLATLAPVIFSDTARPATLVYVGKGSCDGVKAILSGEKLKAGTTASYWDPESSVQASSSKTAKEESCTIDADIAADLGVSDVFAQSCGLAQQGLPNGFGDFQGPIQSMTFAVNKASAENVISAEAAYIAMGLGTLAPWNNNDLIFRRNADSGTQQMISAAIGVPPRGGWGRTPGGAATSSTGSRT